jgi:hypothetical protein
VINLGEVQRAHRRFLEANKRAIAGELKRAGKEGLRHVSRFPRFRPRTGALQRATRFKTRRTRGGGRLRLFNRKRYAGAIDQGARPHVIRPRRARFLRFYWPKVGRVVFFRRVNHPGNKPYHFLWRAREHAYGHFGKRFRAQMRHMASRF